jgi:hypothetical protein
LDGDTLRDDMIALARAMLELYLGPAGKAAIRISLDEPDTPEFAEIRTALRSSQITASRAVVYRAVVRGELPENTSATLLLNTICGGAVMYAFSALPDTRACAVRAIASYSEKLVDFVLARVPGR